MNAITFNYRDLQILGYDRDMGIQTVKAKCSICDKVYCAEYLGSYEHSVKRIKAWYRSHIKTKHSKVMS